VQDRHRNVLVAACLVAARRIEATTMPGDWRRSAIPKHLLNMPIELPAFHLKLHNRCLSSKSQPNDAHRLCNCLEIGAAPCSPPATRIPIRHFLCRLPTEVIAANPASGRPSSAWHAIR
jgi:hypothetical protein